MASRYLQNEARWAREKAVEASRKAERLRDARDLSLDRRDALRRLREVKQEAWLKIRNAEEAIERLTPARIEATIAAEEATAAQWTALAEEHEARIVETEEAPLFEESR